MIKFQWASWADISMMIIKSWLNTSVDPGVIWLCVISVVSVVLFTYFLWEFDIFFLVQTTLLVFFWRYRLSCRVSSCEIDIICYIVIIFPRDDTVSFTLAGFPVYGHGRSFLFRIYSAAFACSSFYPLLPSSFHGIFNHLQLHCCHSWHSWYHTVLSPCKWLSRRNVLAQLMPTNRSYVGVDVL